MRTGTAMLTNTVVNHGFSETKFDSIGAHSGFFEIEEAEAALNKHAGKVLMNDS